MIACPRNLIYIDDSFNAMGYHTAAVKDNGICNGCGLCAVVCPDVAIEVWKADGSSKNGRLLSRHEKGKQE
jgi:2-oxoglutarate ferredoxin oxidoreductase subunit delta